MTSTGTGTFKLPQAWDTNKPKFNGEDPEDLVKFLSQVGEIIEQAKFTTDVQKKQTLLRYLDSVSTKDEWKSLASWTSGTYEEFIDEIQLMYPEIQDISSGSIERLKAVCARFQDLKISDLGKIKRFGIAFMVEAKKLEKPPIALLNGTQVELYLASFNPEFREEIQKVIRSTEVILDETKTAPAPAVVGVAKGVDRRDSSVPITRVISIAESMARHHTPSNTVLIGSYTSVSDEEVSRGTLPKYDPVIAKMKQEMDAGFSKIENELMQSKDREVIREKKTDTMIRMLQQNLRGAAPHQDVPETGQSHSQNDERQQQGQRPQRQNEGNWQGRTQMGGDCHYCLLPGHYIADCPHKAVHLDLGKLIVQNGRIKMGDGTYIPREPSNKSQRQKVDEHYDRKAQGAPIQSNYNSQPQNGGILHLPIPESDSQFNHIEYSYDTTMDEMRSLKAQNLALMEQQRLHGVYQQGLVPTPQFQGVQYGPYRPPTQVQNTAPAQPAPNPGYPGQTVVPINLATVPTGNPINPAGPAIDIKVTPETMQFLSGMEYGKQMAARGLPATQDQFVTTRGDVKGGAPAPPGF
jgi:hypothetical protein